MAKKKVLLLLSEPSANTELHLTITEQALMINKHETKDRFERVIISNDAHNNINGVTFNISSKYSAPMKFLRET
jgi:hypothetical protein